MSQKRVNFETVELKIIRIDFDDIWQKYSKDSRIEFACFSFCVDLLFLINFSSFKPDTENNANFDAVSSKRANFGDVKFFKEDMPKLILIFSVHNLQTFKRNTLINECSFTYLILVLNCITGSDQNYASHCSELSQLHQQPVHAVLRPTFIRRLF